MDAPKLNPQDTLKESYPKLNQSIDNANEALNRVVNAENDSAEAKEIAEQTQTELRQTVLEGDSSPLAGMLSVGADGTVYEDGPQQRLVAEHNKVTEQLATIGEQTETNTLNINVVTNKAKNQYSINARENDDQVDEIQFYIDKVADSPMQTGQILLNGRDFRVSRGVIPKSGVILDGLGMGITSLKGYGTNYAILDSHGTKDSPIYDFVLSNMKIDGTNLIDPSYSPNTKGVYMTYLVRALFKNLHIFNTPATGLGVDFLQDSLIFNVIAEKCGRQAYAGAVGANGIGIGTGLLSEKETLVIMACQAINNGNNGIMFENQDNIEGFVYAGYAQVIGCTARGNRNGFRNSGNMKMLFQGNHSIENIEDGFVLSSGVSADAFGEHKTFAKETQIKDSFFIGNGNQGVHFMEMHPDGAFLLEVNHIAKNGKNGIYQHTAYELNNTKINDNIIKENGTNGVALTGVVNNSEIKNNHAYKNGSHGIYIPGTFNSSDIENNKAYENGLNGIYLNKSGKNVNIENNKTYNNGQSADMVNNHRDGLKVVSWEGGYTKLKLKNNKSYDTQETKTQRYGAALGVGSGGTYNDVLIEDNDFEGNSEGTLSTVSNTTFVIKNNKGFNPIGTVPVTVGTSPFTYQAGNCPETLYIDGGTVTLIQKAGLTLFTSTGKSLELNPNEAVTIYYTAKPTVNTYKK